MIAKYQPAIVCRFIDGQIGTSKQYHYKVPHNIPLATLHPGGHAIVNSAGSGTFAVVVIDQVLPLGSAQATKAIAGTANLPDMALQAERERITKALDQLENELRNNPMARYHRLAMASPEAAALYARLCQLGPA